MKSIKTIYISEKLHPETGEVLADNDRHNLFRRLRIIFPFETVVIHTLVQKDIAKSKCATRIGESIFVTFE